MKDSCKIKCDDCGWTKEIEIDEIPNWHNVKCPECHKGIIVDDEDLEAFRQIKPIIALNTALKLLFPGAPEQRLTLSSTDFKKKGR